MPNQTNQSNQSTDSNQSKLSNQTNEWADSNKPAKPVRPVRSLLITHLQVKGSRPSLNLKWTQHATLVVTDSELKFFSSADWNSVNCGFCYYILKISLMAGSGRYPSKTGFKKKTKKSRKNTKKTRTSPEKHQQKKTLERFSRKKADLGFSRKHRCLLELICLTRGQADGRYQKSSHPRI